MSKMTLQFQGVCMKSLSLRMHKHDVNALLEYCQNNNLDLYVVLDSISHVKSILSQNTPITHFQNIYLFYNECFELYMSINNDFFDKININACTKKENPPKIYTEKDEQCLLEKSIINDGIIYYDLDIEDECHVAFHDLSLSMCRSYIDGSPLCQRIFYKDHAFEPQHIFMSSDSLHDISLQYQGSVCSFLKLFQSKTYGNFRGYQDFISDILEIIN